MAAYIDAHPAKENSIIYVSKFGYCRQLYSMHNEAILRVSIKYRQSYCIFGETFPKKMQNLRTGFSLYRCPSC